MPLPVKQDESPDPLPVSVLGANRVVLKANDLADLVQQPELGIRDEPFEPS
jgi:hypothetical protein